MSQCIPQQKRTAPCVRAASPNFQEHYGWNPVYWSDYPKQPMWTVPMPKLQAGIPVINNMRVRIPVPHQIPQMHAPTMCSCPPGVAEGPGPRPTTWNPIINENNWPFQHLMQPASFYQ